MMYKVVKFFTDLQDNNRPYSVGDVFPHADAGYPVSKKRLAELAGNGNLQGMPLIQLVEEEPVKATPKKPAAKRTKKTAEK